MTYAIQIRAKPFMLLVSFGLEGGKSWKTLPRFTESVHISASTNPAPTDMKTEIQRMPFSCILPKDLNIFN